MRRGTARALSADQVREVQRRLQQRGHDVGGVDGVIGVQTRAAVRTVQLQLGLPADSYPDAEFLEALRR